MTDLLLLALALSIAVFCLMDWRKGLLVCITIGFLQDVIRKLMPGEPVYFVVLVGLFLIPTILGAKMVNVPLKMTPIHKWFGILRRPLVFFIILVVLQSGATFIRFGSPVLAGIGLMSYLALIPAILLAYYYSRDLLHTRKLLWVYVLCAVFASTGIFFSFSGFEWTVLKSVGEAFLITGSDKSLYAHQGFMRSPEIAAWHAATAACLLIILATLPGAKRKLLKVAISAGLIIAVILTGRRKMLMEVILFGSFYTFFLFQARRGTTKLAGLLLTIGILVSLGITAYSSEPAEQNSDYVVREDFNPYAQRGFTTFSDAGERFNKLGLSSIYWAIQRTGVWGIGAGVGSQGAQHFGGGFATAGGAIEGGLGRIVAELGVIGLIIGLWLGIAMVRYVRRIMQLVRGADMEYMTFAYGLIAFLAANVPVFIVAAPAYGDLFVILMLGWILGFVFSIPRLLEIEKNLPPGPNGLQSGRNNIKRMYK